MDFRKAFDTVCHKILLDKLYHYGIRDPTHSLIENYLYRRQQFVTINNASSSYRGRPGKTVVRGKATSALFLSISKFPLIFLSSSVFLF